MTKEEEFEKLYKAYWDYVYKHLIGYPEDFDEKESFTSRDSFKEQLDNDAMTIKVNEGY